MRLRECRFCKEPLLQSFIDLGMSPLSNAFIEPENLNCKETFYPLHTYVCSRCFLVQLEEFESPEGIFGDYVYFSSYSDSWLKHCEHYVESVVNRFNLGKQSQIIELASNDGYLLQYFKQRKMKILGIEPARNVAEVAKKKGIPTLAEFFGISLAQKLVSDNIKADLLIGNNVLAHVPDINDFIEGMKLILKSNGIITMEFPHLLKLIEGNQFDTIYHEHFSYFSFNTVLKIFKAHDLKVFSVDEISTHGGSLRIYACHESDRDKPIETKVNKLIDREKSAGICNPEAYTTFSQKICETKFDIVDVLIKKKKKGCSIAGYGAPAKGNTLLNFCGIRTDFLDYTVDRSPHKQNMYLPGTHIPVYHPDKIKETKPDYVFILPWNLKDEIIDQLSYIRQWGGKFIIPIPKVEVV